MRIFGHCSRVESADRLERGSSQDRARATKKCGVPEVITGLDHVVEKVLLWRDAAGEVQIAFIRIGIVEMLRCLHEREQGVGKKADGFTEEAADGYMIRVEDRYQLAVGLLKGVVQIAGFGAAVVGSRDVIRPEIPAQLLDFRPAAVIQHVHALSRIVDGERTNHRAAEDIDRLIVRRNKHVDGREGVGQRWGRTVHQFQRLEITEEQNDEPVDFRGKQKDGDDGIGRRAEIHRRADSPVEIARGSEGAEEDDERA